MHLHVMENPDGDYQGWLHRKYVGMTKKLYVAFRLSNDSYFCPHYKLNAYEEKQMNGIKDTIQN